MFAHSPLLMIVYNRFKSGVQLGVQVVTPKEMYPNYEPNKYQMPERQAQGKVI